MLLTWLDARAATDFGKTLAGFFIQRVPLDARLSEKKFASKAQEVLSKMARQVDRFKVDNKLNTYKKAKLANAFKWALKDAGYDAAYIDQLGEWLTMRL